MKISLKGKKAVVAGASKGIGFAIAMHLAKAGASVAIISSNEKRIKNAARQIRAKTKSTVYPIAADLRTLAGCSKAFMKVRPKMYPIDILVNSAGDTKKGDFLLQLEKDWFAGFDLKFYSSVRLCRSFWAQLKAAQGTVVNVIGGFARTPDCDFMIGGAVNAALANFTKALSTRGMRDDVCVNAIHPGLTQTERIEEIIATTAELSGSDEDDIRAAMIRMQGIKRLATPDDIARLALFLCSAQARHIQGTAIAVDGGSTIGVY